MKTKIALSLVAAVACIAAFAESFTCASPDGKNALSFALGENGEPTYSFAYRGKKVVEPSTLGFDIKALGKDAFDGRKPGELRTGFVLAGVERAKADETWKPVWGEESEIRDRHEEMLVKLEQKGTGRRMDLRFRVFDDGMGFRYEFPADDDNSVDAAAHPFHHPLLAHHAQPQRAVRNREHELDSSGKVHRRVVDENAHEAEIRLDFLTPRCK